jgi:hypothetical protein
VALPMDEQRILEEMERMLAADDPKLATRLAAFGQPGFGQMLRTRRARATLSVMQLVLIAAVAAVIYLMSAFRPGNVTNNHGQHSSQQATPPPSRLTTPQAKVSGGSASGAPSRHGGAGGYLQRCTPSFGPNCAPRWIQPGAG